jgi:choline dehydrogenase-like flavoprotein
MHRHRRHCGRGHPLRPWQPLRDSTHPTAAPPRALHRRHFFAVCAGAINSAVILLASANDKHPTGLANSSDQVGRNFMYHQADALLALSTERNDDAYTKTWGTNDFYLKDTDPAYPFPLGQVQPVGSFHHEMMKGDAPPLTPASSSKA